MRTRCTSRCASRTLASITLSARPTLGGYQIDSPARPRAASGGHEVMMVADDEFELSAPQDSPGVGVAAAPATTPLGFRRLKCVLGPIDGERCLVPMGAIEITVPLPPSGAAPRVAVYRVERRRRGRGVAFEVLVYAGNRSV
jgi:hypothetical protein